MVRIKGRAVSTGIGSGRALLYKAHEEVVHRIAIAEDEVEKELWRLSNALRKTSAQLKKIRHDLEKVVGRDSALIIESQSLLLKDSNLVDAIRDQIREQRVRSEWAIKEVERKYSGLFQKVADRTFQEKIRDISDVLGRIIANLRRSPGAVEESPEGDLVLVADDLTPSEAAKLIGRGGIQGIVLTGGGETSHTVILARAREIPTIVGATGATEAVTAGDPVVVDGVAGEVIIRPTVAILAEVEQKRQQYQAYRVHLGAVSRLPNQTRDGRRFNLLANIELPEEVDHAMASGAMGIGLFRTEFLYLDARAGLSEDEQVLTYKELAQKAFPHPAVIRTFDLGRDKVEPGGESGEENPSLGQMAVRMFLKRREEFKLQLRAILRANQSGNIRLLLPMITEIEEVLAVRALLAEATEELARKGRAPARKTPVGIMIEIPGVIPLMPHLRGLVDFFSVGTNDLIQYVLAVDRNNHAVSYLYSPFHPAVVSALRAIRRHADQLGCEITVCGEMAGQCFPGLMLLGLGFTDFSMNPMAISEQKRIFTGVDTRFLKTTVNKLSAISSRSQVEETLIEALVRRYPALFLGRNFS